MQITFVCESPLRFHTVFSWKCSAQCHKKGPLMEMLKAKERINYGVFHGITDNALEQQDWIDHHNQNCHGEFRLVSKIINYMFLQLSTNIFFQESIPSEMAQITMSQYVTARETREHFEEEFFLPELRYRLRQMQEEPNIKRRGNEIEKWPGELDILKYNLLLLKDKSFIEKLHGNVPNLFWL